jgi:ribosomal protein S18 acetylase RimI-like enzyme
MTDPGKTKPGAVRIRELRSTDQARWDELWSGYLKFYNCDLPADATRIVWRRLLDPDDQPYGLVALQDSPRQAEHVVGFVHYHFHLSTWSPSGYCYLEDLFVDASCRGAGAGRALIEAVYRAADQRGATRVYWHTEKTNVRAQALYDKVAVLAPFIQYRGRN